MKHAIEMPLCPLRREAARPPPRTAAACPLEPANPADPASRAAAPSGTGIGDPMPSDAIERIFVLILRCLAAAHETGDANCWDEALDRAEQAFGPRDGTLVVARAAALHRSLARFGLAPHVLPLPCRRLSQDEGELLKLFRTSVGSPHRLDADLAWPGSRLPADTRKALADVVDALRSSRSSRLGLRPAA